MNLEKFENLSEEDRSAIESFCLEIFNHLDTDKLHQRLQKEDLTVFTVKEGERIVAIKIGYRMSEQRYYSWLGGVHPDYRRQGLARKLMIQQHQWCQRKGYKAIETRTHNHFKAMLLLNIHEGFQIIDTKEHPRGLKIILEKNI